MAQVRALATVHHNGFMRFVGEVFDYPDELAKKLKNDGTEGMELVTKKSTELYKKAQAEARKILADAVDDAKKAYDTIRAALDADPTRAELVQQALDAETKIKTAADELASFDAKSDTGADDLV